MHELFYREAWNHLQWLHAALTRTYTPIVQSLKSLENSGYFPPATQCRIKLERALSFRTGSETELLDEVLGSPVALWLATLKDFLTKTIFRKLSLVLESQDLNDLQDDMSIPVNDDTGLGKALEDLQHNPEYPSRVLWISDKKFKYSPCSAREFRDTVHEKLDEPDIFLRVEKHPKHWMRQSVEENMFHDFLNSVKAFDAVWELSLIHI